MRKKPNEYGTSGMQLLALGAVAVVTLISGCYKATFIRDPSAVSGGIERDEWTDFFIFGLVGNEEFDVRQFCGDTAPAMVRTGGNAGTTILSILTIGIYTPRKVYVVCGGSPAPAIAYRIETDAQGKPRSLVRHAGSHTHRTAMIATGPNRWSARVAAGETR